MYLFRIALRNLFRRRRRTLIIAGVLAMAIFMGLVMHSYMGGMLETSFNNIINFESAHLKIGRQDFFADEDLPLDQLFIPSGDMMSDIREVNGFVSMTPVLDFMANVVVGREEFPVRVRVIEPDSYQDVFRTREYVVEAEFIEPGDTGLVIGSNLARMMRLKVGDFYTLLFRDRNESFNTMQGEVKGIVTTPHPDMNLNTVYIDREYAVKALGIEPAEISQLMVRLDNRTIAAASVDKLESIYKKDGFEVRSWQDTSEVLLALEQWGEIEIYFIMALILVIGAIGIVNLIVLSALERTKEIGMMKAMGLKESEIVKIFFLEAGGVGFIGGLIGCGMGAVGTAFLNKIGLDLQALYGEAAVMDMGVPILGKMYGTWDLSVFIVLFIFSIITAMVASILPSYWAARKDPVDAIHHRNTVQCQEEK